MKKIITVLLMLGFIFTANAEIKKLDTQGNKTFYHVTNNQVNLVYVCEDNADFYAQLMELVALHGMPTYALEDNTALNPEVADITKKHGNSKTTFAGHVILNTYDSKSKTYQYFVW